MKATLALLIAVACAGCSLATSEKKIRIEEVPAPVKAAAEKAAPGLMIVSVEVRTKRETTVYKFEGTVEGKEVEVQVGADGKVLKVDNDDAAD